MIYIFILKIIIKKCSRFNNNKYEIKLNIDILHRNKNIKLTISLELLFRRNANNKNMQKNSVFFFKFYRIMEEKGSSINM